ncbi:MAG TPA: zinc-binding dehydrogenase [Myxococcota bacterium]|nr:zinc-binding dehydrogenase [Myxococcota bacterium]
MRQIRVHEHGGTEALIEEQVKAPDPAEGEVLVRVEAVGLNHLDLWVRRGVPGHRFPLPLVPGSDAAGVVVDTGQRVALAPQTLDGHIRGESIDGWYRELVSVPEESLLPIPEGLSTVDAAPIALSALTAWQMLRKARIQQGERVLVIGGTSGVGHFAVQIAHNAGCHVVATARSPAKRELCLELGADTVLDSDAERFPRSDVVIEHVGAATWPRSLRALDWRGRLVTCGATTGATVEIDLRVLFFKQQELIGSTMGTREDLQAMWEEVRAGRLRAHVGGVFEDLSEAHTALEGGVLGKVVALLRR